MARFSAKKVVAETSVSVRREGLRKCRAFAAREEEEEEEEGGLGPEEELEEKYSSSDGA